jgi:serine/threonine protein kinase
MTNDTQEYNIAKIRQLLLAAFTPEELRRFCYDHATFRPVLDAFGLGQGFAAMVDRLVEYCDRHLLLDDLLASVKRHNPGRYARFEPHLMITRLGKPPAETPGKPTLEKPPAKTESKTLKPGDTIRGQYRILELIRKAGMSRVWLAEQPEFGKRKVAIKEPLLRGHRELERRWRQEIDLAPQLERLPHIVRAYTLEHRADGTPLLVMEYVDGGSLAQLMKRNSDGLPLGQSLKITREILKALAAFHNLPDTPVHRDVKPSNILLDCERGALLGDFGLAQLPGSRDTPPIKPHPGTPLYKAPEQESELDPLTPAADLYAAGCVLFEMLTGKRYKEVPAGTRVRRIRQGVPAWLDKVLIKALAEEPYDRYGSAEDFAMALASTEDLESEAKKHYSLGMERLKNGDLPGARQQFASAASKYNELGDRYVRRLCFLRATRSWISSHRALVNIGRS